MAGWPKLGELNGLEEVTPRVAMLLFAVPL